MTREEVQQLGDFDLNIALGRFFDDGGLRALPTPYTEDRNALAEAEATLTLEQWIRYLGLLLADTPNPVASDDVIKRFYRAFSGDYMMAVWYTLTLPPRRRAEVLLLTLMGADTLRDKATDSEWDEDESSWA